MRRVLLVLTALTIAGWSQPAQQQAQTPMVVKVEMPSTPNRDFIGYLQALGPLIAVGVLFPTGHCHAGTGMQLSSDVDSGKERNACARGL
jgi:hypothetical protein